MITRFHTVICGSGPAGLAAALASIRQGRRTLLLEKNQEPAGKLLVSGSGKCNFSNTLPEEEFMLSFGRNGRFMTSALRCFGREHLLEHLHSQNVRHTIVDDRYFFPASLKAADIRDAFLLPAQKNGLILASGKSASHLLLENGRISGVELADKTRISCEKVILATGGNAMPQLGASAGGLDMAAEAGHKITPPLPAMAPLCLQEKWITNLSGISLPDAEIILGCGSTSAKSRGTLLFTHDGFSGMAALNISDAAYRCLKNKPQKLKLNINFLAERSAAGYLQILQHLKQQEPDRLLRTGLSAYFPRALAAELCKNTGNAEIKNREIKENMLPVLAKYLSAVPITLSRFSPMEKAMAMSGGVSLKEVDPETMESRLVPGLYFAGEILDLTGPCGGFNIQFAFSSGYLAGNASR